MFKKLLTVGTLVAGIALTGGIGVASANVDFSYNTCKDKAPHWDSGKYTRYVVKDRYRFDNVFSDSTGKWYFKGYKYTGKCYIAKYEAA
ncbi:MULTISPECIES: hypothetical protein [Photorhabdus]|uniref:Antimicrobial protein n=1 Tax=Photorhabdus thracensis TaxID=230089 RepID=A0A0F7LTP9_9GAMM|nr:hypothetical protein [Photorhabdus thracensis]AKH65271.1 hypothetical protein VY86_19875 [Photorhabdus thracensis]